jgi:undecaprenyl diphosphate synthase
MANDALRTDGLPRHVAIIMDGNGRWAERRGLSRVEGHRAGKEAVSAVVRAAGELGIEVLTLYAFSIENWNRPQSEVTELMRLAERYLDEELPEVLANDIQVRAIGRLERLPPLVRSRVEHAVEKTRDNGALKLVFALSYGGRAEIVDAANRAVVIGAEVDEETFASLLNAPDMPDPDLLIRTSGELRISNFLLWQLAYAELVFVDTLWPDFGEDHLRAALDDYASRRRRFGGR